MLDFDFQLVIFLSILEVTKIHFFTMEGSDFQSATVDPFLSCVCYNIVLFEYGSLRWDFRCLRATVVGWFPIESRYGGHTFDSLPSLRRVFHDQAAIPGVIQFCVSMSIYSRYVREIFEMNSLHW